MSNQPSALNFMIQNNENSGMWRSQKPVTWPYT